MAGYNIPEIIKIDRELTLAQAKCVQLIAEEGKKKLREFIMNNWYNAYSPGSYDRTMEFLESAQAHVTSDTAIIEENPGAFSANPSDSGWGQHASLDGTPFVGENILSVLEDGTNGGISPRNGDSAKALDETERYLEGFAQKAVQQTFGAMAGGVSISIA